MREAGRVVRMSKNWMDKEVDRNKTAYREGYNKAIGDFKFEIKSLINELCVIRFKDIDEIAEQLKAGDVD